jgi:hypothetical protein
MAAFDKLYIEPDVGFTTTVCTNCMTFGFALLFWHNFWHNLLGAFVGQCAGDNHFSFIAAVGAFAYMFDFLLCHFLYLDFLGLLDTYDLDNNPLALA